MSTDATQPQQDTLRFDRVEPTSGAEAALLCEECREPIAVYYFETAGKVVCSRCKTKIEAALGGGDTSRAGRLARAAALGLGGGIVGGIVWYLVAVYGNVELGIIAILVGYLVGMGVRRGSAGRGGRRYQVAAALITYLSIAGTYAALGARELATDAQSKVTAAAAAAKGAGTASTAATADEDEDVSAEDAADDEASIDEASTAPATTSSSGAESAVAKAEAAEAAGGALGVVLAVVFILGLPIILNVASLPGGAIGLLIVFIALRQAWKMNHGLEITFTGPHRVAGGPRAAEG